MDSHISASELFRFTDPRQERIYRRLLLIGPGPAAMFRDSCQILEADLHFSTATHLVGHLVRETEGALRDVLQPLWSRGMDRREQKVEIRNALNYLGIDESEPIAQAWMSLVGAPHRWAHRDGLMQTRPVNEEFREFWNQAQVVLDVVLEKLESRYLATLPLVDKLLAVTCPTQAQVKQLRKHVPHNAITLAYFFSRLESPAWLEPLRAKGYFRHPPTPVHDEDAGTVSFPSWPASGYLARMAVLAPEAVHDIALQIPDTQNIFVHADLADAVLQMPSELAKDFVSKAKSWLESPNPVILAERLGKLMSKLTRGNQTEAALDLAGSLLAVVPDDPLYDQARARFNDWGYERILRENIRDLREVAPEETLALLCDLLEQAVRLSQRGRQEDKPEDSSFVWRPAIEDHVQNPSHVRGVRDLLVSAVRDVAEALIESGNARALRIVEGNDRKVFQRIGLHLRRKYPDVDPEGTPELLTSAQVFDDIHLHHEYFHLLREQFGSLPTDAHKAYLSLVGRGPHLEGRIKVWEQLMGQRPSEEEIEGRIRHWQYEKLWPVRQYLQGKWRELFDGLSEEFGELEHADLLVYEHGVKWGPTSPRTARELAEMSIDQLLEFLSTPVHVGGLSMDSVQGVGRQLKELVASDPDRFSREGRRFQELDPTYVRSLIEGFAEAVKQKLSFPWRPVIELCQWVMEQPREILGRQVDLFEADPDWVPARLAVARLLSTAFEAGDWRMPYAHRSPAWRVLKAITEDPEPTPEYEAQYGGSNMDPATLSINTTRGGAMHAVVRYALWVRRHILAEPNGEQRVELGFGEMPEVRSVLDDHLDPGRDPSPAVRAVYGQWFSQLAFLDEEWVNRNVLRIFPTAESQCELRDAAWETYLAFHMVYDNVYPLLQDEYRRAVERIGSARSTVWRVADPDERLAGHLVTLYWRGKLGLGDPEGLLTRFFDKADDALRGRALAFVGRALRATEEEVPSEIIVRLQELCRWRLETARTAESAASHIEELSAFGWWFVSGKFDDRWAMTQLREALELSGWAEPDHLVVERLAELATEMPYLAVRCLTLMAENDRPRWYFHGWKQAPRTILAAAIDGSDQAAREAAIDEVHRLWARGHLAYRDLLP